MPFKCPSCRERVISFGSKLRLVLTEKSKCPNCQKSLTMKGALALFGVLATLLIMSGSPLILGAILSSHGISMPIWSLLPIFIVSLLIVAIFIALVWPISEKSEPQ